MSASALRDIEMELPYRAKERTEHMEPIVIKSSMDRDEPRRASP